MPRKPTSSPAAGPRRLLLRLGPALIEDADRMTRSVVELADATLRRGGERRLMLRRTQEALESTRQILAQTTENVRRTAPLAGLRAA